VHARPSRPKKFLVRHPENEDVGLAIRSEGADKKVVVEEVLCAVAEDDTGLGHHAAQRVRDHPYLARQLSGGETWTDPQRGNPIGCRLTDGVSGPKSVVRWKNSEISARHERHNDLCWFGPPEN
jgi:hypothetical protein